MVIKLGSVMKPATLRDSFFTKVVVSDVGSTLKKSDF